MLTGALARGAAPEWVDPASPMHRWFEAQENHRAPEPQKCCGEADCRPHRLQRTREGTWLVEADDGQWLPAPPFADKSGDPNPFSFMGACIYQGKVRCIWPPGDT